MQAVGQLSYIRPYVDDFTAEWLITNSLTLTAGAMILVYVSSCPEPVHVAAADALYVHACGCPPFANALDRGAVTTADHQRLWV
jgi:hypothetical protein